MKKQVATLIISSSETDSNLYYATGFLAPDPFMFLQIGDEKIIIMSDLELDRAKAHAKVDTVLSYTVYEDMAKKQGIDTPATPTTPTTVDVLHEFMRERGIKDLTVPASFGIRHAILLKDRGYNIEVKNDPFFEERTTKSEDEIENIVHVLRQTERAVDKAIGYIKNSEIRDGYLYSGERQVTSEYIKSIMAIYLLENDLISQHTIVSCGEDTSSPHIEGEGPLMANLPIIIDVFPRSAKSRYYADITRTVVRGAASQEVKRMYASVLSAQELAVSMIKDGENGMEVHEAVLLHFKGLGYESGEIDGYMQGFFHGTGHGVGLDIHEPPRISKKRDTLHTGNVVTVEPGLYYKGIGGVRLEDMIVVQKYGVINLTEYPKILEV